MGPKDFLIIKALSLPLATHFRCFLSWGCFFGEIEGCSRLGGNDKAACGCACCCWKQISCESFPLCYENWRHWNSYRLKWLSMLKNYYLTLLMFCDNWENVEAKALYAWSWGVLLLWNLIWLQNFRFDWDCRKLKIMFFSRPLGEMWPASWQDTSLFDLKVSRT